MKYELSLSEDRTYVRVRVLKPITEALEREFAQNAIKDAKRLDIAKFLVDVRGIPNVASSFEQCLFGYKAMNQFGLGRNARIAVVVDADDKSHDFIETTLVNAGYRCRLFPDADSALQWLGE
jgi:hypothetical protein